MTDDTTSELCGQGYAYDDRTCDLPLGHEDGDHHRCGRFHWLHHAELISEAQEDVWDVWDEPIDSLNGPAADE